MTVRPGAAEQRVRTYFGNTRAAAQARASTELTALAREGFRTDHDEWDDRLGVLRVVLVRDPGAPDEAGAAPLASPWAIHDPAFRPAIPRRRQLTIALACFVILTGIGVAAWPRLAQVGLSAPGELERDRGPLPRLERGACRFVVPEDRRVDCGDLVVRADRSRSDGRSIRLHYAVFRTDEPTPAPDPVVFLEGGPGYGSLAEVPLDLQSYPFLDDRDLVLFDQRGTGYSRPSLRCAEIVEAQEETWSGATETDSPDFLTALRRCHDRLQAEGVDLDAYTTRENAADVEELRLALGYRAWNLYGPSYGSRLALEVMHSYPAGVRSAVLDSVLPPEVDLFGEAAINAQSAFEVLFRACLRDPDCSRAYPSLSRTFRETVKRLDDDPPMVDVPDANGESSRLEVDGGDLVEFLFDRLYETHGLASVPRELYRIHEGDYEPLARFLVEERAGFGRRLAEAEDGPSHGMHYSVVCADEAPFTSFERIARGQRGVTKELAVHLRPDILVTCLTWSVEKSPASANQPVASSIPTLLLAGEFDPITPSAWARQAARGLSRSRVFVFPRSGHVVLPARDCARSITTRFLDDPDPANLDDRCLAKVPPLHFAPRDTVFADDFSEPLSGWPVQSGEGHEIEYAEGGYRVRLDEGGSWAGEPWPLRAAGDVRVEATVHDRGGSARRGLSCRVEPGGDRYFLGIGDDGTYLIERVTDEKRTVVASARGRGVAGRSVRLAAECHGGVGGSKVRLVLSIDGEAVVSGDDADGATTGTAGVEVGAGARSGADVLFHDFVVKEP